MITAQKKNYIMVTGTSDIKNSPGLDYNKEIGLTGNHAYSILSLHYLELKDNNLSIVLEEEITD